ELERDPGAGRRRWFLGAGLAAAFSLAVAAGPLIGGVVEVEREPPPMCPRADEQIASLWNDQHRFALEQAYGADATLLITDLDRYAGAWLDMQEDACADTHIRNEQSERMLDLRMQCLDERKRRFATSVEMLSADDHPDVADAVLVIGGLPGIERCDDPTYLESRLPLPDDPAAAAEVLAIQDEIATARTLLDAKRRSEANEILGLARSRAAALEYRPLLAQIDAELLSDRIGGSADSACDQFEQAVFDLVETGQDELAARAARKLLAIRAKNGELDEGELRRWFGLIEAWNTRNHAPAQERARAQLLAATALAWNGKSAESHDQVWAALATLGIDAKFNGIDQLSLSEAIVAGEALNVLSVWSYRHGDYNTVLETLEHVGQLRQAFPLQSKSTDMIQANNIAAAKFMVGEWGEAQKGYRQMEHQLTGLTSIDQFDSTFLHTNSLDLWLAQDKVLGRGSSPLRPEAVEDMLIFFGQPASHNQDAIDEGISLTAQFYIRAGDLDRARQLLRWSPQAELEQRSDFGSVLPLLTQGELAMHEGDDSRALALFELAETRAAAEGTRDQTFVAMALDWQG
ncbi:MAG: hypothetical protein KC457_30380, partial [Myxococcales bacterium]|nr:hypothetical protein [Myxococcales bacterium]